MMSPSACDARRRGRARSTVRFRFVLLLILAAAPAALAQVITPPFNFSSAPGVYLDENARTPETIPARFAEISNAKTAEPLKDAFAQTYKFVAAAAKAKGVKLE